MRYPAKNGNAQRMLNINKFDGGLNEADNPQNINDNQLSEATNIWRKERKLTNRPALRAQVVAQFDDTALSHQERVNKGKTISIKIERSEFDINVCFSSSSAYCIVSSPHYAYTQKIDMIPKTAGFSVVNILPFKAEYPNIDRGSDAEGTGIYFLLYLTDANGPVYKVMHLLYNTNRQGNANYFHDLCENGTPKFLNELPIVTQNDTLIYRDIEFHIPQILLNGKGTDYSTLPTNSETEYSPAVQYEGRSILTPYARFSYMTDGASTIFELPVAVQASASFPVMLEYVFSYNGYSFSGKAITDYTGSVRLGKLIDTGVACMNGDQNIGNFMLRFKLSGDSEFKSFVLELLEPLGGDENYKTVIIPIYAVNNITLTAAISAECDNTSALFTSTLCDTYSASTGTKSGATLFFAGNGRRNRIFYTDVSKLYVSENAWIDIGRQDEFITALAKQSGAFVIFKERSIYYMSEVQNDNITADDIINGKIVDVSLANYYYPVYPLTENVGCTRGDSVVMCGNRLIWSGGGVYCLRGISNKADCIAVLSRNIKNTVSGESGIAFAYKDYYGLFNTLKQCYVMNTDNYAYTNYSYYKKENGGIYQEWYKWTFDGLYDQLASKADGTEKYSLKLIGKSDSHMYLLRYPISESANYYGGQLISLSFATYSTAHPDDTDATTVESQPNIWHTAVSDTYSEYDISVSLATKRYTMNSPFNTKHITKVYIEADGQGRANISVCGDREQLIETVMLDKDYERNLPRGSFGVNVLQKITDSISTHRIMPNLRSTRTVMIRFNSKSGCEIGAISIYYQILGEVR